MLAEPRSLRALLILSALGAVGLMLPLPQEFQLQWLMNLAYAPLFAGWAWLACDTLASQLTGFGRSMRWIALWVALSGGLLALGSELLQLWIPGRWADWRDLLANLLGLAAGIGLWWLLRKPVRSA